MICVAAMFQYLHSLLDLGNLVGQAATSIREDLLSDELDLFQSRLGLLAVSSYCLKY